MNKNNQILDKIVNMIRGGESETIEFKECKEKVSKSVYESICAFANNNGGHIFLGVADDTKLIGISENLVKKIKDDIITTLNDKSIFSWEILNCVLIQEYQIEKNLFIIDIFVQKSQNIIFYNKKIFFRKSSTDLDITNNTYLLSILRSEKEEFDWLSNYIEEEHFIELIDIKTIDFYLNNLVSSELLKNEKDVFSILSKKDKIMSVLRLNNLVSLELKTNTYKLKKVGLLLFGKKEFINKYFPYYKTKCLISNDLSRLTYNDYLVVESNLISAFNEIINFFESALPEPYIVRESKRISTVKPFLKELVSNVLMHRNYFFDKIKPTIIQCSKNFVLSYNPIAEINDFEIKDVQITSFSKIYNPEIVKVFRKLGYAEELGTGLRKMKKDYKSMFEKELRFFVKDSQMFFVDEDIMKKINELDITQSDNKKENNGISDTNFDTKLLNDTILNGINDTKNDTINLILKFLDSDPEITQEKLSQITKKSLPTIKRIFKQLVDNNIITRDGTNRKGSWKIVKK
ncbi:RNA-binding domain-containing protein [Mycoplasma leonicaptivi]|uniref:RNA-binding domain-containing protein n=1 Tax=Mycoplasma leonicaptivi TaxID=36742 RepID=UPI0004808DA1|nr:RNA-binding domain-containing protein [Mycoplasma leonicaptivi]